MDVATLYRWASHGCRGVRLETIQIGGTKCTSREALDRSFEELSALGRDSHVEDAASPPSPTAPAGADEDQEAVPQRERPWP